MRYITILFVSSLIFYSCEKDEPATTVDAQEIATSAEVYANMDDILLESLQDPIVRNFIRAEALKRITYDYEVIYGMVKHDPMIDGRTLEQVFLSVEAELVSDGRINGSVVKDIQTATPLLSINVPVGIFDWNTEEYAPAVVLDPEANKKNGTVEAYFADGTSYTLRQGQTYEYPVITLADNERMLYKDGEYELDRSLYLFVAPSSKDEDNPDFSKILPDGGGLGGGSGGSSGAYDNCKRIYGDYVSLTGISMDNVSNYELLGRPELRLNVLGGGGVYLAQLGNGNRVVEPEFNPDREDVKQRRWDVMNAYLFRWEPDYGDKLTFRWDEEDSGVFSANTTDIRVVFNGKEYSVTAPAWLKPKSDYIGRWPVNLTGCLAAEYGVASTLRWRLKFSKNP